jgi:hypothetical protein
LKHTRSKITSDLCRFKLEVFIWRHVVYVPKSSTTFHRILIRVIFRSRDMQEYIYMFSITLEWKWLYCVFSFLNINLGFTVANILICVISRPRDMQEYIFMFNIALEWRWLYCNFSFTDVNLGFTVTNICLPSSATRPLVNSFCNGKTNDLRSQSIKYNTVIS